MFKFAKIINPETGLCQVGFGDNTKFYQSIGMNKQDVKQSDIDGCWYLSSKCPMQTEAQQLIQAKQTKQQENLNKANEAVLKGYVTYKGCQFETNTDNQSNMTATANLMQAQGIEVTQWLSKDNIPIELTLSDFLNIGGLILNYKTNLWTNVYAGFEAQIEAAQTIEDVENIVITYGNMED